jgi:hypothetical protein
MDSTLREAYEPRGWDSNPSPGCAKPVSVDALFPSAGKWFLEAETRPSQAGPRGRHFGLSGRAFSLPAGNPPEMTAILRRSGARRIQDEWLVAEAVSPNRSPSANSLVTGKRTGKNEIRGRVDRIAGRKSRIDQHFTRKLPYATEQGIISTLQGMNCAANGRTGKDLDDTDHSIGANRAYSKNSGAKPSH